MKKYVLTTQAYNELTYTLDCMQLKELITTAELYGYEAEVDEWGDLNYPDEDELRDWIVWAMVDEGEIRVGQLNLPPSLN